MSPRPFDMDLKRLVFTRDEAHCWLCGESAFYADVHHRLARKQGGANARVEWINNPENLLLLHRGCHDFIEDNPKLSRSSGWMISDFQDPEDVLVWSGWERTWVRIHGPEFYRTPVSGILAPFAGLDPPLWSTLTVA
jgi:hypothetical protein